MAKYIFSFLIIIFLACPFSGQAVEIPMGVSPKEVSVEKFVPFDEPLNVDYLPDGTPGYLSLVRGDGAMKDGDHTGIPLSGIRYSLHFWNVGEAGGESGFWLWKKNHADATLTVNYEVVGPGNKWIQTEKGFMGMNSFTMEVPNKNPEFNPIVYNLTFSGGPDGEFNEKKPYKHKKGHGLWGFVDNGEAVSLNFPPSIETGDNPFRLEIMPFGTLNLDKNIFGDWPVTKEDCVDSLARFNSMSGTVEVKKIDKGEWVFAKYDMVLCAGDIIKTGEESQAHVLWPFKDYFLGAETQLLIKKMPKPKDRTAVEIISGKVKANFQKALEGKDIYTEEGFPNYVMGIKGTTIEVEVGVDQSIFRLLEGSVELAYKNDPSKKILVASGEEILAKPDGVMEKKNFDATSSLAVYEAEKKTWVRTEIASPEEKSAVANDEVATNQTDSSKSRRYLVWIVGLAIILFLGFVFVKMRKKK
jgi:hypothetical protein